jgi:hypothetical protein
MKPDIFDNAAQLEELRQANQRLLNQVRKMKNRDEELVKAVHQGAYDAFLVQGLPRVTPPIADKRTKGPEVALWHMTDFQGSKVTTSYNTEIMIERVRRFVEKAVAITEIQRSDHPVRDCTIMFGGDMVEGLFNFSQQVFEVDMTIMGQFVTVSGLLRDIVVSALSFYENVTVVAEWGNHGRIGSKRDYVPRSDNIDRMCYEMARQLLAGEPRLVWQDCPNDIQQVEIGNYRALLCHGDEPGRNGFVSPGQFQNHANKWKAGGYRWAFQDVYVGHYHRHASEPLADGVGAIYWTGSTESDNRYARDGMGVDATPSQRLHFVNPEKGRVTAQYQLWLDE